MQRSSRPSTAQGTFGRRASLPPEHSARRDSAIPPLPPLPPLRSRSPQPPILHASEQLNALYGHYNVLPAKSVPGAHLMESIQLTVVRDAHLPTHVLALLSLTHSPESTPILAPIRVGPHMNDFTNLVLPQTGPTPVPYAHPSREFAINIPIVPVAVPHPPSVPLLLLFALKLEKQVNLLAYNLLPPLVVAEFPHAATMAQVLAGSLTDNKFNQCVSRNLGFWKNVLALGYEETTIITMIQTVWNVTAEARRIRRST